MVNSLEEVYDLLKGHESVFLDDNFICISDFEEELNYMRYPWVDSEPALIPIYSAVPIRKPIFTMNDLCEKLEDYEYYTENMDSEDLIKKDEEKLNKINELFHSLVLPIYEARQLLFYVLLYADEEKGFEIIMDKETFDGK